MKNDFSKKHEWKIFMRKNKPIKPFVNGSNAYYSTFECKDGYDIDKIEKFVNKFSKEMKTKKKKGFFTVLAGFEDGSYSEGVATNFGHDYHFHFMYQYGEDRGDVISFKILVYSLQPEFNIK